MRIHSTAFRPGARNNEGVGRSALFLSLSLSLSQLTHPCGREVNQLVFFPGISRPPRIGIFFIHALHNEVEERADSGDGRGGEVDEGCMNIKGEREGVRERERERERVEKVIYPSVTTFFFRVLFFCKSHRRCDCRWHTCVFRQEIIIMKYFR